VAFLFFMLIFQYAGIATRYGMDGQGIEIQVAARLYTPVLTAPTPWGPHSHLYNVYQVSYPEVKRWVGGLYHSPHLAPKLKKE
jgi:hypothetical protein